MIVMVIMVLIIQIEGELQGMGNLLKKDLSEKFTDKSSPAPLPTPNTADLPLLPSNTPDHSGNYTGINGTYGALVD